MKEVSKYDTYRSMAAESRAFIQTLKNILKTKGITYAKLSEQIGLSEPSVKRIFSEGTFTLTRLEQVCQVLGLSVTELVNLTQAKQEEDSYQYSLSQERFFSENPKFLAFWDLLIRFGDAKKVRTFKNLPDARVEKYLKKLEELGLIERLPEQKVKFLVSKNVVWQKDGPLRRTFLKWAREDFVGAKFDGGNEAFNLLSVELSSASVKKLLHQIKELADDVNRTSTVEKQVGADTKNHGVMLSVRPWIFSVLEDC